MGLLEHAMEFSDVFFSGNNRVGCVVGTYDEVRN